MGRIRQKTRQPTVGRLAKADAIALYGVGVLADMRKGGEAFRREFMVGSGYSATFIQVRGRMGAVRLWKAGMAMPLWLAAPTYREGETLATAAAAAIDSGRAPDRGVYRADGVLPLMEDVAA